jgi:hypothetical protein
MISGSMNNEQDSFENQILLLHAVQYLWAQWGLASHPCRPSHGCQRCRQRHQALQNE